MSEPVTRRMALQKLAPTYLEGALAEAVSSGEVFAGPALVLDRPVYEGIAISGLLPESPLVIVENYVSANKLDEKFGKGAYASLLKSFERVRGWPDKDEWRRACLQYSTGRPEARNPCSGWIIYSKCQCTDW